MPIPLTHDVLKSLKSKGYTVLVAENKSKEDWYIFTPEKWDVESFLNDTMKYSFDDHEILIIDEALKLNMEDLLNHEVKFEGE